MPLAGPSLPFLEIAAWAGNAPAVRALLACPRIVVGPKGIHPPALIRAVWRGDVEIVKILCEDERIDVNAEDGGAEDNRLLVTAAEYRHWEIVRYLLRRRDINVEVLCKSAKTVLYWAVEDGNLDMVKLLVEEGGADDGRVDVNVADGARETPVLHLAVRQGDPEIVRCLLRRGDIHVDARCPSDETALCWAAREGNLVIVRLLVEEGGADINLSCGWIQYLDSILPPARGENGGDFLLRTPLHFAAIRGHLSVVQFLVECERVDINARDVAGDTPLDHAVRHGDKKIVRVLKNNGAIDKRYAERRRIWGDVVVKIFGCFSRRVQKDAVVAGRIR
ncbi:ankyrin [Choiromyces venosus 120613-1]|uniref:Ankyrin n=1 Tax=Choiromyces venosus 120613-1 TaxID=1336337 RepID=A0A3N4JVN6_9PEZI|nr:ankyrin [Choiromyces venosus 120613-1]